MFSWLISLIERFLSFFDNTLKISRFKDVLFLFLYKISLDLVYYYFVSSYYISAMMTCDFDIRKYFISMFAFVFMLRLILKNYNRNTCSSKIALIINWLYFIPMCTYYAFAALPDSFFLFTFLSWLLFMVFQNNIGEIKIKKINSIYSRIIFKCIFVGSLLAAALISIYYNGFRFQLSLIDVYDKRAEVKNMGMPSLLLYIKGIVGSFLPICLLYAMINKAKIINILLILFVAVLNFSLGAAKADAFVVILAIFIFYFYKNNRFTWVLPLFSVLNILLCFGGLSILGFLFIFRLIFVPCQLSFFYFDFFSANELMLLRESLFRRIGFLSPYDEPIVYLISGVYFNDSSSCANQGLIGDAFANFGWYSLAIYPFLWVVIGKVADGLVKGLDSRIIILVAYLVASPLISVSYFNVFLSNGILAVFLLLYLMPRGGGISYTKGLKIVKKGL